MRSAGLLLALAAVGCHVTSRVETTTFGESREVARDEPPRALEPTVTMAASGRLVFVEPLVCAHDVVAEQRGETLVRTRPNMATVIIGLIGVSLGAVTGVIGLSDDDPAGAPATYLGALGLVAGAPLVIGPFFGNGAERVPTSSREIVRDHVDRRCGMRPVRAKAALLRHGALQIFGDVSEAGEFEVSAFTFVDAFALHKSSGLELQAELYGDDGGSERRTVSMILDPQSLARGREGFFASVGVDGTIERLSKVPRVAATDLQITRVAQPRPHLEITVAIRNQGPGEAFGVRGELSAGLPALTGRYVYFGRVAPGATATATLRVHTQGDAAELDGANLSVVISDAHATTSSVPFRRSGPILSRDR
ncbi:MAG TPA: hypothetical protein VML75_06450 [Kofleriaceae bacterium]|nr:hypothetical protein [Kofleriaceae bacterium]